MNKKCYTIKKGVLKDSLAFMQHFKFVNWWIGEFVVSSFDVTNRLFNFKTIFLLKLGSIFDQAAKLGKASRDAYNPGLLLIFF